MGTECLIYGLRDPRTDVILYVGQTTCGMARPRAHWHPSTLEKRENPILANKLRAILKLGLKPGIEVLENCNLESDLNEAEIYWIAKCRDMGYPLTNVLDGGTKPPKIEVTEEYRAKLRAARARRAGMPGPTTGLKRTEESKAKMSAIMKGRPGHALSRDARIRSARNHCRPFKDESGNLYLSIMEASESLNIKPALIAAALENKSGTLRNRKSELLGHTFVRIATA